MEEVTDNKEVKVAAGTIKKILVKIFLIIIIIIVIGGLLTAFLKVISQDDTADGYNDHKKEYEEISKEYDEE